MAYQNYPPSATSTAVREYYRRFHFTQAAPESANDVSGEANFRTNRNNDAPTAIAGEPGHPGIWRIASVSATQRCVVIGNSTSMNEVIFGGATHYFHSRFRSVVRSDGTNTFTTKVGWCSDLTTTLGVGVYAYIHPTDGKIKYRCLDAVSNTEVDSGVVYTDNTWIDQYISVTADGVASFLTQGTGYSAVGTQTISANIPGTALGVMALWHFRTAGTTSRPCDVDFCEAWLEH